MPFDKSRRIKDPLQAAEAAFKAATTKPLEEPAAKRPSIPKTPKSSSLCASIGMFSSTFKTAARAGKTGSMKR